MSKCLFLFTFMLLSRLAVGQDLTVLEARWLQAGAPVLAHARQLGLPLDIIVQPQPHPGAVPLALGFAGGRCKLVLSMRGNRQAEDVLRTVPPAERPWMIEAMMAHEIGHCWRYAQGDWHVAPSGFVERAAPDGADATLAGMARTLQQTRREEGYADLVALAWTRRHHPDAYQAVHRWMADVRGGQSPAGTSQLGSHDTLAWLQLAADGAVFDGHAAPFEQRALWLRGLADDR